MPGFLPIREYRSYKAYTAYPANSRKAISNKLIANEL